MLFLVDDFYDLGYVNLGLVCLRFFVKGSSGCNGGEGKNGLYKFVV